MLIFVWSVPMRYTLLWRNQPLFCKATWMWNFADYPNVLQMKRYWEDIITCLMEIILKVILKIFNSKTRAVVLANINGGMYFITWFIFLLMQNSPMQLPMSDNFKSVCLGGYKYKWMRKWMDKKRKERVNKLMNQWVSDWIKDTLHKKCSFPLRISSVNLLKKSLIENFIFCAVIPKTLMIYVSTFLQWNC